MKYFVIFVVLIGISLSYSNLPDAEARTVASLHITLEDETIKQNSFITADGGVPVITIQKGETVSFPFTVNPRVSEPLPVNFFHSIESAMPDTRKSTLPDMKIEFEPFYMILKPDEPQMMNVTISTLNYTQHGEHKIRLTAQYPQGETLFNTRFDVLVVDENQYDNTKPSENFDESFSITQKQVQYNIPYKIINGVIDDVTLSCKDGSLLLQVTTQNESDVSLTLDLPRNIMDPKINGSYDRFIVLRDGQEIEYEEIPYAKHRKLSMSFSADTDEVEIIQSFIPEVRPEMCKVVHDPPYSYMLPPLKQIQNGVALFDVVCSDDKIPAYRYDNMNVACVTEETHSKLVNRGWALLRFALPDENPSHVLCNRYDGKWHPEHNGCRGDISDLQCSLMGGKFVDNLKICYNDICPENKTYTLCVTESTKEELMESGWGKNPNDYGNPIQDDINQTNDQTGTFTWDLEEYTVSITLDNIVLDYIRAEYHNQKILMYVTMENKSKTGLVEFTLPKQAASLIFDSQNCTILQDSKLEEFFLHVNQKATGTLDAKYTANDIILSATVPADSGAVEIFSMCSSSLPSHD